MATGTTITATVPKVMGAATTKSLYVKSAQNRRVLG
jgi:hypothetical protein